MNKIVASRTKIVAAGVGFAVLVSLFSLTFMHAYATGAIWYVNASATGNGSGTSPANAMTSIQTAVNAASLGDTIDISGTQVVTTAIQVNIPLTIKGESGSEIDTTGSGYVFSINPGAIGTTISGLTFKKTDTVSDDAMLLVNANNVSIESNVFTSPFSIGDGEVIRGLDIANGITGLDIGGNTFSHLRQPAYINVATGTVHNNETDNTKGWVVVSPSTITFTGNTWGTGSNANVDDIVIIANSPAGPDTYSGSVWAISQANNNAFVLDKSGAAYSQSAAYVNAATGSDSNDGSSLSPLKTINAGISRIVAGGTVKVYPGSYNETAPNSTLRTEDGGGTYQFGLFLPASKPGITVVGVDASGNPITNANNILAHVTTNSTADFGPDGVLVEGANDTIQALDIGANAGSSNKTIEDIADNFTLKYSEISDPAGGDLYIDDFTGPGTTVNKYTVTGNIFANGATLDIASGAGAKATSPVTDRQITGNTFTGAPADYPYALISFSGTGGQAWYVYPVGGAVIAGNTFSSLGAGTEYIRQRGTVSDQSQFDWASYWNNNTFDAKVMTTTNGNPSSPRPYSYSSYTNAMDIGTSIQNEMINAQNGDTELVGAGTYAGNITPAVNNLTIQGQGNPVLNLASGYGIDLDETPTITGFKLGGFTVNASPSTTYALKAHMANGLTLTNDIFNGGTGNTGGGVDLNTTSNVTLTNVTSSGFHKNGFAYTPQYQNSDTPASGITFNNVTASNNGWTGISFYTVGNDNSTKNPSTIGGTHSIAGVTFTGTNTVSGNGAGIHIEGDSDAHEAAASTPANTVTTDGTTLDLSHVAFSGNASYDIINYQTAPVNAIGATFDPSAITGDAMSSAQRTVEDGKIIDQLDHAAYGLVTYYHNTGNLVINNYICPTGTTVTRAANGVGLAVPAGCVPGAGTTFGYVHGTQTDNNSPFPELGQTLTVIGTTNTSGTLTISLPATGRYLVAETDLSGNQLPANAPLGLYCTGDGDTSATNDNQELTFVPQAGTTNCVAYGLNPLAAPTNLTPADGTVTADPAFSDTWSPVTGAVGYQYETSYSSTGTSLGTVIYSDNSATASNYDLSGSPVIRHNGGTPPATYYWHVRAVDKYGNVGPWSVINKVTVDTDSVTTNPANPIDTTDATLNGTVGATNAGNTSFWWGTTKITGTLVAGTDPGSSEFPTSGWSHDNGLGQVSAGQSFSKQVTGLSPNTLYYFVAWAQINGQWQPGSVMQFTTGNGTLPSVTTNDASSVGLSTATLNGTDGPVAADDTSFWWGTTSITGTLVAGTDPGSSELPAGWQHDSGLGVVAASGALQEPLTGLLPNTTYNYVAWVKSAGTWYPGNVKTFTTSSASPEVHIYSYVDKAIATAAGTNNAVFPMETTWTSSTLGNQSGVQFTLSPKGWGSSDSAYEASYVGGANGDNYSAWELTNGSVVAMDCSTGDPYALVGYTTGVTLAAAQSATPSATVPAFTNLQNDQYMIVWNKTCAPLPPTPGVTTNAATNVSNADATLNGANGGVAADQESFWVSTSTIDTSTSNIPAGVYSTPVLTGVAAGAAFQDQLSLVTTQGITTGGVQQNMMPITPSTTYYYVAWSHVNGSWYPGSIEHVTTSAAPVLPAPTAAAQSVTAGENKPLAIALSATGSGTIAYSIVSNPTHGTLSGTPPTVTYAPNAGYTGSDSFTFKANNGSDSNVATVSITVQGPPVLVVNPANPAKLAVSSSGHYSDNGATITGPSSDVGRDIVTIVDGGATSTTPVIDLTTPGTHTILYVATDAYGNEGTTSRTVIVSGPPVITLTGNATINLTVGGTYTEQGATAADLADGTDPVTPSGTVDTTKAGTYTVTYNAVDSVGNNAAPVTRTVIVSAAPVQHTQSLSFGGNGPVVGSYGSFPLGQVLGASTSTVSASTKPDITKLSCSTPLLSQYMRIGKANNPAQVKLLQTFLNGNMNAGLSVSGYFGISTEKAVEAFQTKYASLVLTPWNILHPTGYVYKTTEWQINELNCATLNAPFPTL